MTPAKRTVDDLAIFKGDPLFEDALHVGRPNVGNTELFLSFARDILEKRWLTNVGPYTLSFEEKVAEILGVEHCIAMCNGTVALEIAARALDLQGEVIVPSFTFVATAHALQWQEITPVFCDIGLDTHTLDPTRIESLITPRTSGIIGVHLWGRPCHVEALDAIAKRHGLKLMFDAAHAFGCSHGSRMIGNFGELEVFSFHATKVLNTFEGGAIVTNNGELADRIQFMRNFGFSDLDTVNSVGTNGKMDEISAAMGLAGLDCFNDVVNVNRKNYCRYRENLKEVPGISLLEYDEREQCNYHYIVAEVNEAESGIARDVIVDILHRENVIARRYFYPGCHRMEPYRSYFPHAGLLLPNTEQVADRVMCLPNGTAVGEHEIDALGELLGFIVAHGSEISALRGEAA